MVDHRTLPRIRGIRQTAEILARHPRSRIRLLRAREAAGLTRVELAMRLGCSRYFVQAVETGKRDIGLRFAERWAKELDIKLELFLSVQSRAAA